MVIQCLSRNVAQIKENSDSKHSWRSISRFLWLGVFSFVIPLFLPFQKLYFFFSPLTFQKLSHQTEKKTQPYGDELAKTLCQTVAFSFALNLDRWLSADTHKCRNKWIRTSAQGPSRPTWRGDTSHVSCECTSLMIKDTATFKGCSGKATENQERAEKWERRAEEPIFKSIFPPGLSHIPTWHSKNSKKIREPNTVFLASHTDVEVYRR